MVMEKVAEIREKAILVGVDLSNRGDAWTPEESLRELAQLVETAGGEPVGTVIQRRERRDHSTFIGEGKVEEVEALREASGATLVVFDAELSPAQLRNLNKEINGRILDRTAVILDIFAQRALTREGKLQVELAQLSYMLPRLIGQGEGLSRLGGGIGTRGPGETKLEVDRRRIRHRIAELRRSIDEVREQRRRLREQRQDTEMPLVALVGYTNAGKSTLLNAVTGATVLTENKLFATLDPTTRRVDPPEAPPFLMTDTVGFIQKLPTQLVAAFRATLEEILAADLILLVLDAADPKREEMLATVEQVLAELGAADQPRLLVLNQVDRLPDEEKRLLEGVYPDALLISAVSGKGLEGLVSAVERRLRERVVRRQVLVPFNQAQWVDLLHRNAKILSENYTAEGVALDVEMEPAWARRLESALGLPPSVRLPDEAADEGEKADAD
ncbi:MAG: GTPase HflX [Symbiobacteriia bacterium]